ncbi:hypothetical protein LP419_04365 [Massilia sp. H-1]|nr:hypothetical protein LP419_04365 [Massilia sp. H-1]
MCIYIPNSVFVGPVALAPASIIAALIACSMAPGLESIRSTLELAFRESGAAADPGDAGVLVLSLAVLALLNGAIWKFVKGVMKQ